MLKTYYSEMGEEKPQAQMEANNVLGSYFVKTPLEIKGRGIKYLNTYKAEELTKQGQYRVGWKRYKVTEKAFENLCKKYNISFELLLD